jgi:two-component sensor histidine kinase
MTLRYRRHVVCRGKTMGDHAIDPFERILINELSHRIKNTMTVVQALASQSFRGDRCKEECLAVFESRLKALAGAHDLLLSRSKEAVAVCQVVRTTVAPHDPDGVRIRYRGPALSLTPEPAMSVAMAVHELLTNAIKYGALSVPGGWVDLRWEAMPDRPALRMTWKEHGGPAVRPPRQRGFGTRFIECVLGKRAGGGAKVAFEPDGVRCVFDAEVAASTYAWAPGITPAAAQGDGYENPALPAPQR